VAAALTGDMEAAARVELQLPDTGVCSTRPIGAATLAVAGASSCCGGPAPTGVDACCADDAEAKAVGEVGCGCPSTPQSQPVTVACCGDR